MATMDDENERRKDTKARLEELDQDFLSFNDEMEINTRKRKEKEESRINKLKGEQTRLDKTLKSEIKRRGEMSKTLQKWSNDQIEAAEKRWKEQLADRKSIADARLQALAERVLVLESNFETTRVAIPRDIVERAEKLNAQLNDFKQAFEDEKIRRKKRENEIAADLSIQTEETKNSFEDERTERERKFTTLASQLTDATDDRVKRDDKFQELVKEKIADLRNTIQEEARVQEEEDSAIICALKTFSEKLQRSIREVNKGDEDLDSR